MPQDGGVWNKKRALQNRPPPSPPLHHLKQELRISKFWEALTRLLWLSPITKVTSMWAGCKMVAELVPFSSKPTRVWNKSDSYLCLSVHRASATSLSSFVTITRDPQLPNLFSKLLPVCWKGKSTLVSCGAKGWRRRRRVGKGCCSTLALWQRPPAQWHHAMFPQDPVQAICHILSVRSHLSSEASFYETWAKGGWFAKRSAPTATTSQQMWTRELQKGSPCSTPQAMVLFKGDISDTGTGLIRWGFIIFFFQILISDPTKYLQTPQGTTERCDATES